MTFLRSGSLCYSSANGSALESQRSDMKWYHWAAHRDSTLAFCPASHPENLTLKSEAKRYLEEDEELWLFYEN